MRRTLGSCIADMPVIQNCKLTLKTSTCRSHLWLRNMLKTLRMDCCTLTFLWGQRMDLNIDPWQPEFGEWWFVKHGVGSPTTTRLPHTPSRSSSWMFKRGKQEEEGERGVWYCSHCLSEPSHACVCRSLKLRPSLVYMQSFPAMLSQMPHPAQSPAFTLASGISKPMVCQTYGLGAGRLSRKWRKSRKRRKHWDSYKQGVECRINGNHVNDENHGNPGCKPWVPQTTGLEIPDR